MKSKTKERERETEGLLLLDRLRKKVKAIFQKYHFTVTAALLLVGTTIGVVISSLSNELKGVANSADNGLQTNGETVYFDEPIPKVDFIKLISCSLFNSWYTLKNKGSAALGDEQKDPPLSIAKIPPGHYTLDTLAKKNRRKCLRSPMTYFVHCDLSDKDNNLFNGKKSDVLARFDVRGQHFQKESYIAFPQQVLHDCRTDTFTKSIRISVRQLR